MKTHGERINFLWSDADLLRDALHKRITDDESSARFFIGRLFEEYRRRTDATPGGRAEAATVDR